MSKHTSGPWWVEVGDKQTTIEAAHQTICTDVSNNDAALIAAAPEMLAVLKIMLDYADGPEERQQLKAVIAKAEGRE